MVRTNSCASRFAGPLSYHYRNARASQISPKGAGQWEIEEELRGIIWNARTRIQYSESQLTTYTIKEPRKQLSLSATVTLRNLECNRNAKTIEKLSKKMKHKRPEPGSDMSSSSSKTARALSSRIPKLPNFSALPSQQELSNPDFPSKEIVPSSNAPTSVLQQVRPSTSESTKDKSSSDRNSWIPSYAFFWEFLPRLGNCGTTKKTTYSRWRGKF